MSTIDKKVLDEFKLDILDCYYVAKAQFDAEQFDCIMADLCIDLVELQYKGPDYCTFIMAGLYTINSSMLDPDLDNKEYYVTMVKAAICWGVMHEMETKSMPV